MYRRQRISDQLKVEKEVFPECIQAPIKYCNKRKSLNIQYNNKENKRKSVYHGENTSHKRKLNMDKIQYIEKWIQDNKTNSPRIPLADLNINNQNTSQTNEQNVMKNNNPIITIRKDKFQSSNRRKILNITSRKKKYTLTQNKNQSTNIIDKHKTKQKNDLVGKITITESNNLISDYKKKNENDESGIVMDDDYIIIDDTPTEIVDKDKLALLAIEAAEETEKQKQSDSNLMQNSLGNKNVRSNKINEQLSNYTETSYQKDNKSIVPFIKKGLFVEPCMACRYDLYKTNKSTLNNVSFSIDNVNFVTDVKISKIEHKRSIKSSVAVQTDINEIIQIKNDLVIAGAKDKYFSMESQDIFVDEPNKHFSETLHKYGFTSEEEKTNNSNNTKSIYNDKKNIIIEESDSDLDMDAGQISIDVTAEVHRSCEPKDYGILTEIPPSESSTRKRRVERRPTPASTDSSDKENFDPNRSKRRKYYGKKFLKKKPTGALL
ncbi:probable serine/threonine-protein kinase DDB_G0283337 isoform X2 [Galleria mellonella]|uniref:Probable serine/threonine-protein kinase DDB_G0283337 isoform X2 n=1 Tax=Galleria mellonella TaxID=7137 RepID=A0A6J3BW01_GALME|nr:probable serine/threonine-protein kinase DDB_G0283337 isoform X2 [Galleria mellonella]